MPDIKNPGSKPGFMTTLKKAWHKTQINAKGLRTIFIGEIIQTVNK